MRVSSRESKIMFKSIASLQDLKMNSSESTPFYPTAQILPQFLMNNLKAEKRVVKYFKGQFAILKAFYFSLMKLAFEIENEEHDYIKLIKNILISEEEFQKGELEDQDLSDNQYRLFFKQFFENIQNQQLPSFQQTVKKYPIVDRLLLNVLKKMVPFSLIIPDDTQFNVAKRIIQYLCQKFKIKLQIISGCFKFIQSDIFVYVQNLKQVYLIFIDQLGDIRQLTQEEISSENSSSNISLDNKQKKNSKNNIENNITQIQTNLKRKSKNSKIVQQKSQFQTVIQMLDSNKGVTQKSNSIQKNSSQKILKQNEQKNTFSNSRNDYYGQYQQKQMKKSKQTQPKYQLYSPINQLNSYGMTSQKSSDSQHKYQNNNYRYIDSIQNNMKPRSSCLTKRLFTSNLQTFGMKQNNNERSRLSNMNKIEKSVKINLFQNKPLLKNDKNTNFLDQDSGYCKFTQSGFLDYVDQQYKQQIKKIKKQYRQNRQNIKKFY